MELLNVFFSALISVIVIFILTKLVGNKQMSEANMFDYINGITIGSIAAEMATSLENDIFKPLIAMIVYTAIVILLSYLSRKSIKLRRIFSGKSIILFDEGKIYYDNLKKAGLDINEFLVQCRLQNYFDLSEIQTAIFETNGKISFLSKEAYRSLRPSDMQIVPKQAKILRNVIIDGKIVSDNLREAGQDEQWLKNTLKKQGVNDIENVFLATCDENSVLTVYDKITEKNSQTPFE